MLGEAERLISSASSKSFSKLLPLALHTVSCMRKNGLAHTLLLVDNIILLPHCCQPLSVCFCMRALCTCICRVNVPEVACRLEWVRPCEESSLESWKKAQTPQEFKSCAIIMPQLAWKNTPEIELWTLAYGAALELGIGQWTTLPYGGQTCLKVAAKLKRSVHAVCSDGVPSHQRATLTDHASNGPTYVTSSTSNIDKRAMPPAAPEHSVPRWIGLE